MPAPWDHLRHRGIFVAYCPLGDPRFDPHELLEVFHGAGVDIVEIGLPTRDPYLDGPAIAKSLRLGYEAGITVNTIVSSAASWRTKVPNGPLVVLVSYPQTDLAQFDWARAQAVDGFLMIDRQLSDTESLSLSLAKRGVASCSLLPWKPSEEAVAAAAKADGYVMVQSRPGKTGPAPPDPGSGVLAARLRDLGCRSPIVFGFGIRDRQSVRRAARYGANGVVVGTACLEALERGLISAERHLTELRLIVDDEFDGGQSTTPNPTVIL
ncbi:MAG: tryptophan synthase subunit alpha [Acidimicrobiia bacterium]